MQGDQARSKALTYSVILALAFAFGWGSIPIFRRFSADIDSSTALALRYLTAAGVLFILIGLWALKRHKLGTGLWGFLRGSSHYQTRNGKVYHFPSILEWLLLSLVMNFLSVYFFFLGVSGSSPITGVSLSYTYPVIVTGYKVWKENLRKLIFLLASVGTIAGTLISASQLDVSVRFEAIYPLLFSVTWGIGTVLSDHLDGLKQRLRDSLENVQQARALKFVRIEELRLHGYIDSSETPTLSDKGKHLLAELESAGSRVAHRLTRTATMLLIAGIMATLLVFATDGSLGLSRVGQFYLTGLGPSGWTYTDFVGILSLALISTAISYVCLWEYWSRLNAIKKDGGLVTILQGFEFVGGAVLLAVVPPQVSISSLQWLGLSLILVAGGLAVYEYVFKDHDAAS